MGIQYLKKEHMRFINTLQLTYIINNITIIILILTMIM